MKRILILVALSSFLCSMASAGQGGGGESTKPKAILKKTSGSKPNSTPPPRLPAPPTRLKTPTVASLTLNSNLPDAAVTINGRAAGTTDSNGYLVIGSIKPGAYTVSISKQGFLPDKRAISLSAGDSETLNFELTPITQSVNISSTPPECEIYIDEILRGSTDASGSVRVSDVPVGEHQVTIRKSRYREASFPLSLSSEKEGQINANLELAIGFLTVATNTPNARIEISGIGSVVNSVSMFECQPGTYSVTVSSPLYITSTKEVSVSAGREAQLSMALEVDSAARNRLTSEAQEAYSRKEYDRAITLMKTLLSADSKQSKALTVLAQSYFMKDDFDSFARFGSQAIEAGGRLEIPLRHKHGFGATVMHPVKLVLTAQTVSFDPQLGPDVWCSNKPFTVSLKMLGAADVGGNHENDITLRLVFVEPDKPKKTTTLSFADRESYLVEETKNTAGGFIRYKGATMVSRRQANWAVTAIAALFNRARAGMNGVNNLLPSRDSLAAGNPDPKVPATTTAGAETIDGFYVFGTKPNSQATGNTPAEGEATPRSAVDGFLALLKDGRQLEAQDRLSADFKKWVIGVGGIKNENLKSYYRSDIILSYEIVDLEEASSESARARVRITTKAETTHEDIIELVRENGKWLVAQF